MAYYLSSVFIAFIFQFIFGSLRSWPVCLAFAITNLIFSNWIEKKLSTSASIEIKTKDPITEDARKYLQKRVEEINISQIKETPKFNQYSENDLKYMGMGKN